MHATSNHFLRSQCVNVFEKSTKEDWKSFNTPNIDNIGQEPLEVHGKVWTY